MSCSFFTCVEGEFSLCIREVSSLTFIPGVVVPSGAKPVSLGARYRGPSGYVDYSIRVVRSFWSHKSYPSGLKFCFVSLSFCSVRVRFFCIPSIIEFPGLDFGGTGAPL